MSIASDVGGAIGLLLGLCGINLIEMVLLAWDMICGYGKKKQRQTVGVVQQIHISNGAADDRERPPPVFHLDAEEQSKGNTSLQLATAALEKEILRQQLAKTRREVHLLSNAF